MLSCVVIASGTATPRGSAYPYTGVGGAPHAHTPVIGNVTLLEAQTSTVSFAGCTQVQVD